MDDIRNSVPENRKLRGSGYEYNPQKQQLQCPSESVHFASFPVTPLSRWEFKSPISNSMLIPPDWTHDDFILHSWQYQKLYTPDLGLLLVKYVYKTGYYGTRNAIIWYQRRCHYCKMFDNPIATGRIPCCDPFQEARDGTLDFKFPGVVALLNTKSKKLILRKDWCWANLCQEQDLVAVYSRNTSTMLFGKIARFLIRLQHSWPLGPGEVKGVVFIEDLRCY